MASITTPVTVVNQPFDTSGNGGRRLVRLSNGWLIVALLDTTTNPFSLKFYKSQDNGQTWQVLTYVSSVGNFSNISMVANGTIVTAIFPTGTLSLPVLSSITFDAVTVQNQDLGPSKAFIDSSISASGLGNNSLAIAPDGTLHAAWASKNSTYPNSFNIRYSKSTDGGQTWSAPEQVTKENTSGKAGYTNPSIVLDSNGVPVIFAQTDYRVLQTGISTPLEPGIIVVKRDSSLPHNSTSMLDSRWTGGTVFSLAGYTQSSPCAVVDNAGVIHVVWHGADAVESAYNIRYSKSTDGGATWSAAIKITSGTIGQIYPSLTVNKNNQLFCYWTSGTPANGLRYAENLSGTWSAAQTISTAQANTNPSTLYDNTLDFSSPLVIYKGDNGSSVVFRGTWVTNQNPSITLTSPTDNQTLSEGTAYPIEGSATDADANSNVVIKCQINNGPIRNIGSGVSDGITPISFARTLMYRDKRIWDGSADIAGADLAENTDHVLKVWAEDDQGGVSDEVIRTFRVIWNRPPTISGQDENLGTISTPPNQTYSVTDPEGHSFTIEEYLDGELLRSFPGVAGQEYTATIPFDKWLRTSLAQHTLRIRATDSAGQFAERIYTFTRTDDRIEFTLNYDDPNIQNFFILDDKPTRILVTLDGTFPSGSQVQVEACNNALDASPTWEDITGPVLAGRGYIFQNATKTAAQWAINIRVTIYKGTATEPVILNGFGGAFD